MVEGYIGQPWCQSSIADIQAQGGSIRGFLNDGNTEYKNHHSVDSLAFGHCDYSYRNLGRPSHLQIKQQHDVFEVVVDGKSCFKSDKVGTRLSYLLSSSDNPWCRSGCLRTISSVSPPPRPKRPTPSKSTNSSYPPPPPPREKNPVAILPTTPHRCQTTKRTNRPPHPSRRMNLNSPTCTTAS